MYTQAVVLVIAAMLLQVTSSEDKIKLNSGGVGNYEGDILLAAFFPMHERAENQNPKPGSRVASTACGSLKKEDSIQMLEVLFFALDQINSDPELLPGITLGVSALDSCSDENHALEQGVELLRFLIIQGDDDIPYECSDGSVPELMPKYQPFHKIVGVLGGARSAVTIHLASLLRLFAVPQVGEICLCLHHRLQRNA